MDEKIRFSFFLSKNCAKIHLNIKTQVPDKEERVRLKGGRTNALRNEKQVFSNVSPISETVHSPRAVLDSGTTGPSRKIINKMTSLNNDKSGK